MKQRASFVALIGLVLFVLLGCTLIISTYRTFGHTWDEPEHLSAGMELLDRGVYTHDIQHPPFARLAIALGPYLDGRRSYNEPGPSGEQEGREILYKSGNYDRTLTLARLGVLPFFITMIVAVWLWARRWCGDAQAILAVFFLIATPALIGHAGLAVLDVPGSALCIFALYWLFRWVETSALRHALLFGLAAGLAIGSKLYAIPYLAVCIFVLLSFGMLVTPHNVAFAHVLRRERWSSVLAALATCVVALILSYGGRFETLETPGNRLDEAINYAFGTQGTAHDAAQALVRAVPVPMAAEKLVLGIKTLDQHNRGGHFSYLMGRVSASGWWYFYVVDLAIKTPLPLLLLGAAGLGLLLREGWQSRDWKIAAPALCFFGILIFCSLYSHINIGIRHVLILYPFLAIAAAEFVVFLWKRFAPAGRAAIAVALLFQASVLWTAFPDYFPYFNVLAGRAPENYVVDSDLDWGQDLRRLQRVIKERDITELWLVYRGTAAPWLEEMPKYHVLFAHQRVTGWVAISLLAKQEESDGYAWLHDYRPVQRVGKSIDLYFIPPPR